MLKIECLSRLLTNQESDSNPILLSTLFRWVVSSWQSRWPWTSGSPCSACRCLAWTLPRPYSSYKGAYVKPSVAGPTFAVVVLELFLPLLILVLNFPTALAVRV